VNPVNTSHLVRLLNTFITIACKIIIVAVVLLTGAIIFSVRMAGTDVYRYPELRVIYAFDNLDFSLDRVHFTAKDGHIVTVARAGEENEVAIFGKGQISWYREPRLKTFTKVLISLNTEDLRQIIAANREHLKGLLTYESDAFDIRRKTWDFLMAKHRDRFSILGLSGLTFTFLRLPPPNEITFDLYDRDQDLGDYMSNYERANQPLSAWEGIVGNVFSILFLVTELSVLLLIALVPTVFLTYGIPAFSVALSMIREAAYREYVSFSSVFRFVLTILLAVSLILILQTL
jgi:hypothetical protein